MLEETRGSDTFIHGTCVREAGAGAMEYCALGGGMAAVAPGSTGGGTV